MDGKKTKRRKLNDVSSKALKTSARKRQSAESTNTSQHIPRSALLTTQSSHDSETFTGDREAKKRKRTKSKSYDSALDTKSGLDVPDTQPRDKIKKSKRSRLAETAEGAAAGKKSRKNKPKSTEELSAGVSIDASGTLGENESGPGNSLQEHVVDNEGAVYSKQQKSTSQQETSKDGAETRIEKRPKPRKIQSDKISSASPVRETSKAASRFQDTTAQNGDSSADPPSDVKLGSFTTVEKQIADQIFDEVRNEEGLSSFAMNEKIQKWGTVGKFKTDIIRAFPTRPPPSLRKFCQRRYHNLDRGAWVEDQDETLRRAYAEFPDKWTKISGMVGRTTADCRDRWRNHLQFGDGKQRGPWSTEEEELLKNLVSQCVDKAKQDKRKNSASPQDVEQLQELVNWEWVSQQHGNHRSAKQCREKHRKLQTRDARIAPSEPLGQGVSRTSHKARSEVKHTHREKRAMEALKRFGLGDYYDVFVEIHSSFPNHTSIFYDETRVVWEIVSQKHPGSRFSAEGMHGTLRRIAFEEALATWTPPSKAVRKGLKKAPSIAAKALILANWLDAEDPDGIQARAYVPKPTRKRTREKRKSQLSNIRVERSSDDDSNGEPEEGETPDEQSGSLSESSSE